MTGSEILDLLGLRLEDPSETNFTEATKLDAVNVAIKMVVNLVDSAFLSELETLDDNKTVTAGKLQMSVVLSYTPIRKAISVVYDDTNNVYCSIIEAKDIKRTENSYLTGSAANPVCYVFGDFIYFQPASIAIADIWYLKEPKEFVSTGATGNQLNKSAECELNPALHEIVTDLAEGQLWKMDNKLDRAQAAQGSGLALIEALNARYVGERPKGIGTAGRQL